MREQWNEWVRIARSLPLSLGALAWRRLLRGPRVIGITGSVGKTATKDFLTAILASRLRTVATRGSNNGRTGVPGLVLAARPSHDFVIAEVGIRQRGRMWRSALVLRPDIVVITRVARVHMGGFLDLDTVAREKAALLGPLTSSGFAVLNGDDPRVAAMGRSLPCPAYYFGSSPAMDCWADEVSCAWPGRLELTVHAGGQ